MRAAVLVVMLLLASSAVADEAPAGPGEVEVGLYLIDITSLDEQENSFTVELDVISNWVDPLRGHDEGKIVLRDAAAEQYLDAGWLPELLITNASVGARLGRLHVVVHEDGTVISRLRMEAVVRTKLDFRAYPFDKQSLKIEIESYAYDTQQLRLAVNRKFSGFDRSFEMPEWTVKGVREQVFDNHRVQEGRDFSRLEYTIDIERLSGYYLWKVILPLALIAAISWVVFWMSTDALGRRAAISSTGMLTVIAYQFIIAGSLPRFPYLTLLDKIALMVLILIALTMLENLISSRMTEAGRFRLDRACRLVFPLALLIGLGTLLLPVMAG